MATPPNGKRRSERKESIKKWGKPAIDAGFTILPRMLFQHQHDLKLDPVDLNVLLQIISYWWKASKLPWPSKKGLATRMGVSTSTIRRRLAKLESMGLIERQKRFGENNGRQTNQYSLKGLVDAVHPFAVKAVKRRKAAKAAQAVKGEE